MCEKRQNQIVSTFQRSHPELKQTKPADLVNLLLGVFWFDSRTRYPENLPDKCKMANFANNGARELKIGQNDRSSHSSLAPHAPLWKHFTSEVIPENWFSPLSDDARKITLTRSSNSDSNQWDRVHVIWRANNGARIEMWRTRKRKRSLVVDPAVRKVSWGRTICQ